MLIFRRSNCIITASGTVTLCKRPYSTPVESGLQVSNTKYPIMLVRLAVRVGDHIADKTSGALQHYRRTALFWDNKQRVVVITYRRFGTT